MTAGLLLFGWSPAGAGNESAGARPLKDVLGELKPQAVWRHFYDLTQIPRSSHNEQQVSAFMAEFGRRLKLETIVDPAGNVLIRKRAAAEAGRWPTVVLQAHLDMVAQQTASATPATNNQPVNAYVKDGWVRADGTTLGADGGIGVALIMAVLESETLVHGPIEALFTVGEEDGFVGIKALKPDTLRGRLYINLDNAQEGQLIISCAGATRVEAHGKYAEVPAPKGLSALKLTIGGLVGGHSGMDIDKGRANANQLIARLVDRAPAALGVRLVGIEGGAKWNVIPRQAAAQVALTSQNAGPFLNYIDDYARSVRNAYAGIEPSIAVTATPAPAPGKVMDRADQRRLLHAVAETPNGVQSMSQEVPGQVETSNNLGIFNIGEGNFTVGVYVRSAVDSGMALSAQRLSGHFQDAGVTVSVKKMYASWPPNPNSPLLVTMKQAYQDKFGNQPAVAAVHAGLETSEVRNVYPDMDMVSMGPTIKDEHSPDERLEIASVQKAYDLLIAALMRLR
jgi:dipeptidase D